MFCFQQYCHSAELITPAAKDGQAQPQATLAKLANSVCTQRVSHFESQVNLMSTPCLDTSCFCSKKVCLQLFAMYNTSLLLCQLRNVAMLMAFVMWLGCRQVFISIDCSRNALSHCHRALASGWCFEDIGRIRNHICWSGWLQIACTHCISGWRYTCMPCHISRQQQSLQYQVILRL